MPTAKSADAPSFFVGIISEVRKEYEMKVLVKYTVFIPDNYQGGSGEVKSFSLLLDFNDESMASQIKAAIRARVEIEVNKITHKWTDFRYQINSSEILNEA